jgi:16S rRNA (cytosine1402-N4)-methyltransferase
MTEGTGHVPVLLKETVEAIAPRPGGVYADATVGRGGHSAALLDASGPDGRVIAVDRDPDAVTAARERLAAYGDRAVVIHGEFADLAPIVKSAGAERVDGVVADLGISSAQLDDPERGLSFSANGPLDMRMDRSRGHDAAQLIAHLSEAELADVLYQFAGERRSRPIARSIKRAYREGHMATTDDLRRAVVRVLGPRRYGHIDPATRTFQALRIAVNGELDQLKALLSALPDLLQDRAVAAIISFHSLEDGLVKRALRADDRLTPLTAKPIEPSDEERSRNPRARSAKLRIARRVPRSGDDSHTREVRP